MTNPTIFETMFSKERDMLKPVYFNIGVLERYFRNPQYQIHYSDYRGGITLSDEYVTTDEDFEYLRDFGIAYHKNGHSDRAIVAFADDLLNLPPKMQGHFYSFLLENQEDYVPNSGFVKNLILGEWVDDISIYQALLMEMHYINEMCKAMGLPLMFKKEYPFDSSLMHERPINYHTLLIPTEQSYYDFVLTLTKMIADNINEKTFTNQTPLFNNICKKDADGHNKGSITLLVEWLRANIKSSEIDQLINLPLRKLVKQRQTPAHSIFENEYNPEIWTRQDTFMTDIYTSIRTIRLFFANHPRCSTIEIPDCLFDGCHIANY